MPNEGDRNAWALNTRYLLLRCLTRSLLLRSTLILHRSYVLKQSKDEDTSRRIGHISEHPDAVNMLTIGVSSGDKKMLVSFDITKDRKLENEEKFKDSRGFGDCGAIEIPKRCMPKTSKCRHCLMLLGG